MEQAALCSVVRFKLESIVVLPRDMQVRRLPHDSGRAVGFTCITLGLVLRRIPFQSGLSARSVIGNVALQRRIGSHANRTTVGVYDCAGRPGTEVAFGRSEHAR